MNPQAIRRVRTRRLKPHAEPELPGGHIAGLRLHADSEGSRPCLLHGRLFYRYNIKNWKNVKFDIQPILGLHFGMTARRPPFELRAIHTPELERLFELLAKEMKSGEFTGASVILWSKSKKFKFYRAGVFRKSPALEHLGACKLADRVLYHDEDIE